MRNLEGSPNSGQQAFADKCHERIRATQQIFIRSPHQHHPAKARARQKRA
jgi:hypothetical protein